MDQEFHFLPPQASTVASQVDNLYFFLLMVTTFFTVIIFLLILYFGLRYRRKPGRKPVPIKTNNTLELAWTVIPLILCLFMFVWGAKLYVHMERSPEGAMEINVVGKQWMWKIQHPEGRREINELHVPVGRPVKLVMTSQDVIHSFFIPAFRTKQDVLPGRYTTEWFTATQPGTYHLFCAEYCGAEHSLMIGQVIAMEPAKYQEWLAGTPTDQPMAASGAKLFTQFQCNTCHGQRGPSLAGVYGSTMHLKDGTSVPGDEQYLRESILEPNAKIAAGYPGGLMPTYRGQVSEEQLMELIAYIKSLNNSATTQPAQ